MNYSVGDKVLVRTCFGHGNVEEVTLIDVKFPTAFTYLDTTGREYLNTFDNIVGNYIFSHSIEESNDV